jgi:hypothetical protein
MELTDNEYYTNKQRLAIAFLLLLLLYFGGCSPALA